MSTTSIHTGFPAGTLTFLSELRENNEKAWFDANRKTYEAAVKKPTKAFSEVMAGELERLTGMAQKPKIFRINRDIRFSKDKTPYNTHIHISWMPVGGGAGAPAFMFGLSTEYCTVGCGTFEFPKPMLERYRKTIAGARGEELGQTIAGLIADGYRLNEPALKRIPAGFPADHPRAALSLHKGLALWRDFEGPQSATEPDLLRNCVGHFEKLLPFWRFLSTAG